MKWLTLLSAALVMQSGIQHPPFKNFDEAWQFEQKLRGEYFVLIYGEKSTPETVAKGIQLAENVLKLTYEPEMIALKDSLDQQAFVFQRNDIRSDLVRAYAKAGNRAKSLYYLRELRSGIENAPPGPTEGYLMAIYSGNIEGNEFFRKLLPDAELSQEIKLMKAKDPERHFRSYPYKTGPSQEVSESDRIASLGYVWSEAKYNFANFDLVPGLDWDAEYQAALAKVRKAKGTYEYYNVVREFMGKLSDSHTDVSLPQSIREKYEVRPQLTTALVEGQVVLTEDAPPSLAMTALQKGDIIEKVDGMPSFEYGTQKWSFLGNFSTPQDADVRRFYYMFLRGPQGKPVKLDVRKKDGTLTQVLVPRDIKNKGIPDEDYEFRILKDGTAYFVFNTCGNDNPVTGFRKHLPEIIKANRLIIDIRENGGGNSSVGYNILSHLVGSEVPTNLWQTPQHRGTFRTWGREYKPYTETSGTIKPHQAHFGGKVVVLAGPRSFSAAEDFASAVKTSKRCTIVGMPTGGSTGQPVSFLLPGGGSARICAKRDRMPDGTEFVGKGVMPDVVVKPTIKSYQLNQDIQLSKALEIVNQ